MFDKMKDMAESAVSYAFTVNVDKGVVQRIMREGGEYFKDGVLTIPPRYEGKILEGTFRDAKRSDEITQVNTGSIKEICKGAFEKCTSLTEVKMPNVKEIGEMAFIDCERLTNVEMPNIKDIGIRAFENCAYLRSLDMPEVKNIAEGAF